jgi:hypothetical protein
MPASALFILVLDGRPLNKSEISIRFAPFSSASSHWIGTVKGGLSEQNAR